MGVAQDLKQAFTGAGILSTMDPLQLVQLADGRPLDVTEMACPVRIALHPSYGPVPLAGSLALAVMPGMRDILSPGYWTLNLLDLDIYIRLTEFPRCKAECRIKLTCEPIGGGDTATADG